MSQDPAFERAPEEAHADQPDSAKAGQVNDSTPVTGEATTQTESDSADSDVRLLINKAQSIAVRDIHACNDAGRLIRKLTHAVKQTKEELAPLKTRLSTVKKEYQDAEKSRLKPLVEAEKLVKTSIEAFLTEESARRREEREQDELSRQEKMAERELQIQALEEEGRVEEARTLAKEYPPELPPAKPLPVPQMISAKASRRAEVSDLHALVCYIAEHPEHVDLLRPAAPTLNALARRNKGSSPFPGVEFLTEQKVTSR